MFMKHHVTQRNGNYYYRLAVPSDLKHLIPFREIKHSLKTDNPKHAECIALSIESNVQKCFNILRSGIFSADTLPQIIDSILPRFTNRKSPAQMKLSNLMDLYIKQHERNWTLKSKMENSSILRLLIDVLGDKVISSLTRQMMLDLRNTLEKLPPNIYKKHPNMSIRCILDSPDIVTMSIVSVNKNMARIASVLKYGVREGYLIRNVAEALILPIRRRSDEERSAYSDNDIIKIIHTLESNKDVTRPERYWIPIIAIYSGMRLEEICQLYAVDIESFEGIICFNINDLHNKKLKNISSIRMIPIHPKIIELGLLEHIDRMKADGHERVWPNLTYNEIKGYSNMFVKYFQRFNRQHITDDKSKVFHSFRHSFANKLKQQGVSESLIAELLGHKNHSITMGRYGKRYEPQVLLEALSNLKFENQ